MGWKANSSIGITILALIIFLNYDVSENTYFCEGEPDTLLEAEHGISGGKQTRLYLDSEHSSWDSCSTGWIKVLDHVEECIELLVASSDTVHTKKDKSLWTEQDYNEWYAGNTRQGYVLAAKECGSEWGNLEIQPSRTILVKMAKKDWNESWLLPKTEQVYIPVLDEYETKIVRMREYRFPLEDYLSEEQNRSLNELKYNEIVDWNITLDYTDQDMKSSFTEFDTTDLPVVKKKHGSSGNFTICSSGCNYTTVALFESNEQADLSGTGPAIATITEGFTESSAINFNGWTTTETDYIKITSNGTGRHKGFWNSSNYNLNTSSGHVITISESYVHIDGLQLLQRSSTNSDEGIRLSTVTPRSNITNNIIWADTSATDTDGIYAGDWAAYPYIANNIIYGFSRGCVHAQNYQGSASQTWQIVSNTVRDCGDTAGTDDGGFVARESATSEVVMNITNSISIDMDDSASFNKYSASAEMNVAYSIASESSITSDADISIGNIENVPGNDTDQGAGNYTIFMNLTDDFIDLRLQDINNTNNVAQDSHTNSTAFGITIPTLDVAGTTRPQNTNYDIGAFEVVGEAAINNGTITINLLNSTDFNATNSSSFTFTVNVTCASGGNDCDTGNLTLDPIIQEQINGKVYEFDTDCIEMMISTSDNVLSKLPKREWTNEMLSEEKESNIKQGYVLAKKFCGMPWGNLERDPARGIIVRIPANEWNDSWIEPEYDKDNNIITMRKYRFPIKDLITAKELSDIQTINYNEKVNWEIKKNITNFDNTKELNNWETRESELKLHGSSGTFTICPSGCNYTSLTTAISTEAADLTGTGPAHFVINESFTDTGTTVQIDGYTTTVADYINISVVDSARHNGYLDVENHYTLETVTDFNLLIRLQEDYVRIDGVAGLLNVTSNSDGVQVLTTAATSDVRFSNMIVNSVGSDSRHGFNIGAGNNSILNTIVYGFDDDGILSTFTSNAPNLYISNTIMAKNGGLGFNRISGTITVKNTYSGNNTGNDYDTGATLVNASSEDSTGSTGLQSVAYSTSSGTYFNSITDGSENYSITTDSTLKDAGADSSGDGRWFIDSVDIIGTSRPQSTAWDIGPFELSVASVLTKSVIPEDAGTPFYVTSAVTSNPHVYSTISAGSTTEVSWTVNTNGTVGNTYAFFAYINNTYNNVTSGIVNVTITAAAAPSDTCTYSGSGDHTYQCSDNCNISSTNFLNNTVIINGSGTFSWVRNITNATTIRVQSGCRAIT